MVKIYCNNFKGNIEPKQFAYLYLQLTSNLQWCTRLIKAWVLNLFNKHVHLIWHFKIFFTLSTILFNYLYPNLAKLHSIASCIAFWNFDSYSIYFFSVLLVRHQLPKSNSLSVSTYLSNKRDSGPDETWTDVVVEQSVSPPIINPCRDFIWPYTSFYGMSTVSSKHVAYSMYVCG